MARHGFSVALRPQVGHRVIPAIEVGDAGVAEAHQVIYRQACPCHIVVTDGVHPRDRDIASRDGDGGNLGGDLTEKFGG